MILKFSYELKCDKGESYKNNLDWQKCCRWLNMRRNMMNLMMRDELNSEGQFFNKPNSQNDLELPKKSKKDKKGNKNEEIVKNQHDNIYINSNSNEEKNTNNNEIQIEQIKKIINKNNNDTEEKGNDRNEIKENLDLNDQKSDNVIQKDDELNLKIQNSTDSNLENIGNIKNDLQLNNSNKEAQSISNNPISNYFGIGNNMNISPFQLETFSLDSKNENSKNSKNKRSSFHTTSSLGKNFILKTEIYKSTNQKGNQYKKNNYSDNPIMNYYSGKNNSKFANFYMADIKSSEETDENHYMNFFPNKENNVKDKEYISFSPMVNIRTDTIKESNDIFEEDNLEEKIKLDKSNLINNDSLEKKFNLDFINNSSIIEENPNNYIQNNIETDIKNINNNNKDKNFNINNIDNFNFNNINYNNEFKFPLNQTKNINNNNSINFNYNDINNKFNNNNTMNTLNNMNNQNIFNYNNNNMFDINELNNLKDFKLNKEMLDEMSKIDLNKININFQGGSNYQIPNNYFMPVQNQNDNLNMKFNYITYNNNEMTLNGLPSGKSFYEYSDDDIIKYAIPLIKDQSGCRFLQERIKLNKSFMIEKLFPSIQNNLFELGCDAFGNYFLQALIDIFSVDKLSLFLDLIKNFFTKMCTNQHGTRVIQKIIEQVSLNQTLVAKIENILNCNDLGIIMKSPYGNHIIQKYLISIRFKECTKFIYDYILANFMEVAETKHGVCVIQKCVSEGDIIQKGKLYDLILQNFDELIKNEFGNYLIQYILININDQNKFNEANPIIKRIEDNLIDICKMKFSANVIEKCLENGSDFIKEYLLECILNKYRDHIIELLLDKYAIYIIQKALKINTHYRNKFYEIIKEKKDELKDIDLNDFKYRGAQKVLNSFKDFEIKNQNNINKDNNNNNNFNGNYNNFYNYNADYRNNYNNKRKNKRGKKNYRGK
jgi:hypothetical protein